MGRFLGVLVSCALAFSIGFGLGLKRAPPAQISERLRDLTDREIAEYRRLKTLRQKYERADELLGKMILVLIADLGLRVPEPTLEFAEKSAQGVRDPYSEPTPVAVPTGAPPPLPQYSAPVERIQPYTAPTELNPIGSPTPPAPVRTERVNVTLGAIEFRGRKGCDGEKPGWFTAGDTPQDYRVGMEFPAGATESIPFIEALSQNPRPHVELNQCAEIQKMRGKRVEFAVELKGEKIRDYANLHVRAQNENRDLIVNATKQFRGTFDWRKYQLKTFIPDDAVRVIYGVTFESGGRVWVKGAALSAR